MDSSPANRLANIKLDCPYGQLSNETSIQMDPGVYMDQKNAILMEKALRRTEWSPVIPRS